MLRRLSILMLVLCALGCINVNAQFTSAPAFPGAEGYGRYTTGGRGGTVYHVTRLDDYIQDKDYSENYTAESAIEGTLRYAVTRSGARTVVFDVAGTIELKCPLKIKNGDITILGQTAPGDGICLKNYTLGIDANNVIIRYIRCRMGDEGKRYYKDGSALTNTAFEDDAMNAYHKDGSECNNIIIDHCSISWCVDECGSFYGNRDFTLQWCILSESLRNSVHDKGAHGYGGIWGGEKASFHHNLLADHDSRNPRFDHGYVSTLAGPVDYTNNVLYNWGSNSAYGGENKKGYEAKKFNMINNYYRYGGATSDKDRLLNPTTYCKNCNSSVGTDIVPGKFYISGNYMYGSNTVTNDNTCSSAIVMDSNGMTYSNWKSGNVSSTKFKADDTKFNYNTISLHVAETTYNKVLEYAGASFCRDAVDVRICNDAKKGTTSYTTSTGKASNGSTGGLIDTPSDVGGYPTLTGTKAADTDGDGIPDEWEDDHNLDKNNAADALTYTLDSRGYYTNLEVYANYLVQDITKAERAGATETFEEYYPLGSDDPAPTQTVITASPASVDITGTASASVTLSSNSSGAYSITAQPNESVATASISGSTITITGVAAGSTSLTVTQAASTGYTSATKEISITVTAAQGGGDTPVAGTLTWNYTDEAPTGISSGQTTNTDNGLTYNGTVNDSDKNKLKGIKLNSTGYCYFTKGAVAGTLAITFGPRSGTSDASIKVYSYATTPSAETLIGTTETTTSLATKTIALSATQNNIYLTRGASTETVITKIVFTPSSTTPDTPGQTSTDSEVTALSIDMTSVSIPVGTAALVKAKVTATNNSKTGVNISAADGTIVKTYSTGAIIGVKPGTTTVTFTSDYGGLTKTCEVTVTAPGTTGYTKNGSWYIVDKGSKQGLINAIGQINLDSSSDNNKYIFLPNGTYDLGAMGMTTILTKKVSIIGESEDGVIIKSKLTNGTDGTSYEGLGSATTLLNRGSDLYLQDITIQNAMNYYNGGGRAACLQDEGTSTVAKRVKLLSYQDTYYSHKEGAKYYWEDSEIHGTVDFMCGSSSVFYNRCLLYAESRESTAGRGQCTLTAPAGNSTDKGYCFYDCTIDANCGSFDLGRAWKNGANSVYINTTFKSTKVVTDWFTLKGMSENVVAGTFSTYGSKKSDGSSFAPSSSSKTFTDSKGSNSVTKSIVMSASDAANYTLDKFFTDWQPDQVAAQKTMSTPSASGKTISWSAVSEAAGYLIEKDGEFVGITTATSYTVDEDGTYTVRAANARGGFGEGVEVVVGNVPRTVFELDFEEASDNNYGFTGNCTFSQSPLSNGTHCLHVNQGGGSGDRTANINLAAASKEFTTVTNYTFEFDWGLHVSNQNTSTTMLLAGSETLLTITTPNYGTSTLTAGSVNVTIPNNGYNNQSPCPTTLSHFVVSSSVDGTYLTVMSSGNTLVDNVKIANGLKNITALNTILGRAVSQMALDNIILTTIDPVFSEDENYTTFTPGTYTVKLKKTFPAGKWTSLVLPFSASTAQLMAAFPNNAANTEVAVIKEMRDNRVYFVTQAKIDANSPVLIKVGDKTADDTYTFTNVTVQNSSAPNTEKKNGIMMKGLYKKTMYNENPLQDEKKHVYFVANSKFYDWSYLEYMPPFSAYIYTDAANNVAGAKPLIFMLDGEATGISNIDSDKKDDGLEYNAVGQRISKTAKGLHIKNGKKYFVK